MSAQKMNQMVLPICADSAVPNTGHQQNANEITIGIKHTRMGGRLRPHLVERLSVMEANGISISPSNTFATIISTENRAGMTRQIVPTIVCPFTSAPSPAGLTASEKYAPISTIRKFGPNPDAE